MENCWYINGSLQVSFWLQGGSYTLLYHRPPLGWWWLDLIDLMQS